MTISERRGAGGMHSLSWDVPHNIKPDCTVEGGLNSMTHLIKSLNSYITDFSYDTYLYKPAALIIISNTASNKSPYLLALPFIVSVGLRLESVKCVMSRK